MAIVSLAPTYVNRATTNTRLLEGSSSYQTHWAQADALRTQVRTLAPEYVGELDQVLARWRSLYPANPRNRERLADLLGVPLTDGFTLESCPECDDRVLIVNWFSSVVACLNCGFRGGITKLSSLVNKKRQEERQEERDAFLAAGGLDLAELTAADGAALVQAVAAMATAKAPQQQLQLDGGGSEPETIEQARASLDLNIEGYRRCGTRAFGRLRTHTKHGDSLAWTSIPCGEWACPRCGANQVEDERYGLGKWENHFKLHYDQEALCVVEFASVLNVKAIGKALSRFRRWAGMQPLLARTVGFLVAAPEGYRFLLLARQKDVPVDLGVISAAWTKAVGWGARVRVRPVEKHRSPFQLAVQLRLLAERAIPQLVASGQLTPYRGLGLRAAELAAGGNYIYFGVGFQSPASLRDEEKPLSLRLAGRVGLCDLCGEPDCQVTEYADLVSWREIWGQLQTGKLVEFGDRFVVLRDDLGFLTKAREAREAELRSWFAAAAADD